MSMTRPQTTVLAALAERLSADADGPYLDFSSAGESVKLTAREMDRESNRLAHTLREIGVEHGDRVATLLENHPEHVLHTLALNSIGVCCVPINPDYRAAEIAYLVDHSEPDLILTLGSRKASIAEALTQSGHRPPVVVSASFTGPLDKAARRTTSPRDTGQHPVHLRHDRAAQGLRTVARL